VVEEAGSISTTDAAAELGYSPSWVSQQFLGSGLFEFARSEGHSKLYKVKRG
jgi:hypothetical protein